MQIYLFRHAESEDNRHHVFCGWRDPDLSEQGRIDCQEVAELLKEKKIEIAFSPNLKRNIETVKEILKYHPETKLEIDDRLRERCYGDLQGRPHLELMRSDLGLYKKYHRSYDFPPPNGESIKMVEERVKPFLEELTNRMRSENINVAICAGNNAMRVIRKILENLTVEQMMRLENPYDNYFEYDVM